MCKDANPVKTLFQRFHRAARQATHPIVAQQNLATGTGKSYWALETAADTLIEAREAGESVVMVYVAPQHAHIDITNHHHDAKTLPAAQQRLLAKGVPCVKVPSRTQLTDPDHPHCLYRDVLALEAELNKKAGRQRTSLGLLDRLQQVLDDVHLQQDDELHASDDVSKAVVDTEESHGHSGPLATCMKLIRRRQEQLVRLRQEGFDDDALEGPVDQLKKAHGQLYTLLQRAVIGTLSQASREGATLEGVLGEALLVAPFQLLERQLFPLYRVMRGHAQALGLVAMTADRLMTHLTFPRRRRQHRAGCGDFGHYSGYLEDAVHGLQQGAAEIIGLDEHRTRFLFLVDEADAVKDVIGKPAKMSGGRVYLRGLILDQGRATQVGQTLLHEMPLLFRPQPEFLAIMQGYQSLVAEHPCIEQQWLFKEPADLGAVSPMTPEAASALRRFRAMHRLGTTHPAHHRQQAALRTRLLHLLALQYEQHPVIQGVPEEMLQSFHERLKALCQGASWINLNLDDRTVASAGSTGAFTGGSWAFINLDDERLNGLVAHRDSGALSDVQLVSRPYLDTLGKPDDDGMTFRLEDAFETMLTIAALVHELGTDDPADPSNRFAILRNAYRAGNTTTSAPLTALLRDLSHVRVRLLMQARRPIDPSVPIDDDLAFRTPHLVMQWVPDFEDRYLPGEPGVSVVPCIGYRAWSAEHHLERLISPQAYRYNLPRHPVIGGGNDEGVSAADHEDGVERPMHSLVLISATGGFDATHLGGFCLDMLSRSTHVAYVPMSDEDLTLARQARELRQQGVNGNPGRLAPKVAEVPEHAGLFASGYTPELTRSLLAAADTQSPYKRRELTRIGDLIALLSLGAGTLDGSMLVSPSLRDVLSSVQAGPGEAGSPLVALMLVQSLEHFRRAIKALPTRQAELRTIVPQHLYGLEPGHRRRGRRPVLVMSYQSGSAASTDAQLQRALASSEGEATKALADFLECSSEQLPHVEDASDLLRRDLGCHIVVVAPYGSAARGINLKVDRYAGDSHQRDVDLIVLGMSPFYSEAKPKFEPLSGPPGEDAKPESQRERADREHRNQRRFSKNNLMTHQLAFTGLELAARLNQGGWGRAEEVPSLRYQARDIRLHPDSYLPSFGRFLAEQHVIDLARTTFQAVGRGERTSAHQQQGVLVCEEIVRDLLAADPILYGRDDQGRSLANRLHAASLNSMTLMTFVRQRRDSLYQLPSPSALASYRRRVHEGDEAFSDVPDVPGWKNQQLGAIRRLNEQHHEPSPFHGAAKATVSAEAAQAIVARWEAWHSPDLLFDSTRDAYEQRLLTQGVPAEVLAMMWLPLDSRKQLPIRYGPHGGYQEVVTRLPGAEHPAALHGYPGSGRPLRYQLPRSFVDSPSGPAGHYLGTRLSEQPGPSLRWHAKSCVLHPKLQPDFDGIWGELALDAWLEAAQAAYPSLAELSRLSAVETLGIFEWFDRVYALDAPSGKRCLVAMDAKHYARRTDQRHGQRLLDRAQDKMVRLREWAQPRGYERCLGVYVNTQPQPQEIARPRPAQGGVLVINAFVRIALTDANAPSDVTPARERGAASPLVDFNHAAAVALQHSLTYQ